MASLNGQTIASSYEQLLHTDTDGGGNGNTLVSIKDGDNGTTFGLKLATNKVEVIPSAADDANAFEVSKNDGTAVFTVNTSSPGFSLAGNATITTTDNSDNIALVSTDADANSGPNMSFWRNSGSPADNDLLGQINWYAENDADEKTHMAQFYVTSMDVSDGSEDVRFVIQTILGGATETSRIELLPSETVINQDSKDIDFRVESDGNANMIFVDAGNNRVGVGGSPNAVLDITTDQSRTSKTGTSTGLLHLDGGQDDGSGNNGDITAITFTGRHSAGTVSSIIANELDTDGSHLLFGTSNTYASGVTNTALEITPSGGIINTASSGDDTLMKFVSNRSGDGNLIHTTSFNADNSASQETTYADIRANIVDNSDGTEDGSITFRTMKAGTVTEHITLESDGPVKSTGGIYFTGTGLAGADTGVSSSGHGGNLRFYGNGTNWAVLTSGGKMGIRTTSPNVGGFTDARGGLTISSEDNAGANNYAVLELQGHSINNSGVNGLIMFLDHTTENARIQSSRTDSASYGNLRFFTKGGGDLEEHMRIRAAGNIWIQNGSEFRTTTHGGVDRIGSVDIRDESGYDPVLHVMSDRDSGSFTGIRVTAGLDSPSSAGDCVYMDFFDGDGGHRGGIQCGSTTANPEFFNGSSDERVKKDIVNTSTNGLNIINGLELKDFTMQEWFAGTSQDVTCDFVAQNAEEHFPAMVSEHKVEPLNDEYKQSFIDAGIESEQIETATGTKEKFVVKTVAHGSLIPILVKALQEADDKIDALTERIEALEA
jgi:hypothetical protein